MALTGWNYPSPWGQNLAHNDHCSTFLLHTSLLFFLVDMISTDLQVGVRRWDRPLPVCATIKSLMGIYGVNTFGNHEYLYLNMIWKSFHFTHDFPSIKTSILITIKFVYPWFSHEPQQLVMFVPFQSHFQAALRPARWNSDRRPTHSGETGGEGACLERCDAKLIYRDNLWSLVIILKNAFPKFPVGLSRCKCCFHLERSIYCMVQFNVQFFIFESNGGVPTSSRFM